MVSTGAFLLLPLEIAGLFLELNGRISLLACVVDKSVITKSTLAPFDCVTVSGVSVMDADPSISCDGTNGAHARMAVVGGIMIVVFVLGVPGVFATLLVYHRDAMKADQRLRMRGEGATAITNPIIIIRRRFRKLYEVRAENSNVQPLVTVYNAAFGSLDEFGRTSTFCSACAVRSGLQSAVPHVETSAAPPEDVLCRVGRTD